MKQTEKKLALKKIVRATREISDPEGYLQGRSPEQPWELPASILCFVRRQGSVLSGGTAQGENWQQHHRFVLIAAIQGTGRICVDAETFQLREGEALLVFPFQFHSYHSLEPERICWLFCTFEMSAPGPVEILRHSRRELQVAGMRVLKTIAESWRKNAPVHLLQMQLTALLMHLAATPQKERSGQRQTDGASFLAKINRSLLPHLDRPLGIKHLAQRLGCSESHLRKSFRRNTGTSLGNHIRLLRINRACSLLQQTTLPIGEIATQCGFDSLYSFSRAFRRATSCSPRAYRRHLPAKNQEEI